MKSNDESMDSLDALRQVRWEDAHAVARVADRLGEADRSNIRRARISPNRLVVMALLTTIFVGTAVTATAIVVQRARLYDITISENGQNISNPRLLVAPGQRATMTIEEEDGARIVVSIDESGEATVDTDDGREVTVEVTEITDVEPSNQQLYRMTVFIHDVIVAEPSVIINRGEPARIEIDDGHGNRVVVRIDEDGAVRAEGVKGVSVTFEVIELP